MFRSIVQPAALAAVLVVALAVDAEAAIGAPGEVRWFVDAATNSDRELDLVCERADPARPYGGSQVRGRCGVLVLVPDAGQMGRHDVHLAAVRTGADHRRGPAPGGGAETVPTVDRVV